jgi:hypothetical protein
MILEEETFKAYGYYPKDLMQRSSKPVLATCNNCRKIRTTSKHDYRSHCRSCAMKGNNNAFGSIRSNDVREKISIANRGNTYCLGRVLSEATKRKLSILNTGSLHPRWDGGRTREERNAIAAAYRKTPKGRITTEKALKRWRQLGYNIILPVEEGEVGHHITNEYVIGIPEEVHKGFGGYKREKHRTLVLQWLKTNDKRKYNKVLCVLAKQTL